MKKFILSLCIVGVTQSVFARGPESIYSCKGSKGDVKVTQKDRYVTVESAETGLCAGQVDLYGYSDELSEVEGEIGGKTCKKAPLAIFWSHPYAIKDRPYRLIKIGSGDFWFDYLHCNLIQEAQK